MVRKVVRIQQLYRRPAPPGATCWAAGLPSNCRPGRASGPVHETRRSGVQPGGEAHRVPAAGWRRSVPGHCAMGSVPGFPAASGSPSAACREWSGRAMSTVGHEATAVASGRGGRCALEPAQPHRRGTRAGAPACPSDNTSLPVPRIPRAGPWPSWGACCAGPAAGVGDLHVPPHRSG